MKTLIVVVQVQIEPFKGDEFSEAAKIKDLVERALKDQYPFPEVKIRDHFVLTDLRRVI